jgi:hypothetical protein
MISPHSSKGKWLWFDPDKMLWRTEVELWWLSGGYQHEKVDEF